MEENPGTNIICVFPLVNLCHSSTWLASDLASRFGAIHWIADLEDRKFIRAQNLQRVWTALILFHPAFGLMLPGVRVMTTIFLILQMALWALARQRHPHLYLQLFC